MNRNDKSPPREFWLIKEGGKLPNAYNKRPQPYLDDDIHVIEYDAYLAVKQEFESALDFASNREASRAIALLKERDKLRQELEAARIDIHSRMIRESNLRDDWLEARKELDAVRAQVKWLNEDKCVVCEQLADAEVQIKDYKSVFDCIIKAAGAYYYETQQATEILKKWSKE